MTHKQFLFALGPLVVFLMALGYCVPRKKAAPDETSHVERDYKQAIERLDSTLVTLKGAVGTGAPSQEIQQLFFKARLAYKELEYLTEYFNPYTAKALNGPPLDKVEADDPNQTIIPPTGFQVMEELLFLEYEVSNRAEALKEIAILHASINRLRLVTQTTQMADRHIFDAMRLQVYRVITLGITGFDSPVAQHSLPEAAASLSALKQAFMHYHPRLAQQDPVLAAGTLTAFEEGIAYLRQHRDFDRFDRATFITNYANVLSARLAQVQEALRIPVPAGRRAISARARTLFDKDAFDVNYYAPDGDAHLTAARAELGKLLFFDPVLSGNNARSCASCHVPRKAFADGRTKSVAFDFKGQVRRNAPTVINAALQRSLFHDTRVVFLEDQASDVLANAQEMHGSLREATGRIARSPEYVSLFKRAFPQEGEGAVSEVHLKVAIASYIRSLDGMDARFDKFMRGDKTQLSVLEKQGLNLFMGKAKCATCHFVPLFNGTVPPAFDRTEAEIIGVPASTDTLHPALDPDLGRYQTFKIDLHRYAFKTPTLRNVALTAPYMHNGVYQKLEEVIQFYNKGGGAGLGIQVPNQTLPADPLHLTAIEQKALIAFMGALTDTTAVRNVPRKLPAFPAELAINERKVGGAY
jgi:cytochrome c peroxidase